MKFCRAFFACYQCSNKRRQHKDKMAAIVHEVSGHISSLIFMSLSCSGLEYCRGMILWAKSFRSRYYSIQYVTMGTSFVCVSFSTHNSVSSVISFIQYPLQLQCKYNQLPNAGSYNINEILQNSHCKFSMLSVYIVHIIQITLIILI